MKITLIEPRAPGVHVFSKIRLPRLGLPILGTMLKEKGHDVKIFAEQVKKIDFDRVKESDLIGLSSTTPTAPRLYYLCQKIKTINNKIKIVVGGAHVSFMVNEALKYADYCVIGEGEKSFINLVKALEGNREPEGIPGIAYKDKKGDIVVQDKENSLLDINELPFPDLELIEGNIKMYIKPVITTRGCVHGCNFCPVTKIFGKKHRVFDPVSIVDHIENTKARHIFFYDDNFGADIENTKTMLFEMLNRNIKISWSTQIRADVAEDPELLELMKKTGATIFYIGFESINQNTLKEYNKKLDLEKTADYIKKIQNSGIIVHGMFVIGADNDDIETPKKTVDFALKHKLDTIELLSLTPLPGTHTFNKLKNQSRLIDTSWEFYDGNHVVHKPANVNPYELQLQIIKELKRFYSLKNFKATYSINPMRFFFKLFGLKTVRKWTTHKRTIDYIDFLRKNS